MTEPAGRHALVTGGGSGVGEAIALALAGVGARVTICGRRRAPLERTAAKHAGIAPAVADVTDEPSFAAMYASAVGDRGPVDIVVANAGAADSAPFARTDRALFERMLAVNLTGAFLTFKLAWPSMLERGWGRVIAVASTAGLKGYAYVSAYCAAKHGVVGLVRALALEAAGTGVTVNALCPGFTDTSMLAASVDKIVANTGRSAEEVRKTLAATNPLHRFIRPEEVAAAALWLTGPGSDAVTGQTISVSGGETW